MDKITGFEPQEQIPAKVLLLYQGVIQLVAEGADISTLKVSDITQKAGIGKGTAYEYFDTREEIIVSAILHEMLCVQKELQAALDDWKSFFEKMEYLLELLERKMRERECFLHFIHLLTDSSICGQKLQKKIRKSGQEGHLPWALLVGMIQEGIDTGELRSDLPLGYLCYAVGAQIICFMGCVSFPGRQMITAAELKFHILSQLRESYGRKT